MGVWSSVRELSSHGCLGSRLNHCPCFSAISLTLSSGRLPSGASPADEHVPFIPASCDWLSQLWKAACVRSCVPLFGDPGPSSLRDLTLLLRRRRIFAVRRCSSTSGLIFRGRPRPLGLLMRDAVPGRGSSSSAEKVWAWPGVAEVGEEGRVGGGVVGKGASSTLGSFLGSFLRKVTGTSAIRTSPEATR